MAGSGAVLAVVSSTGRMLRFFDGTTFAPLGDLPMVAEPHEIAVDAARSLLYVSHTYRSGGYTKNSGRAKEISVVDPYRRAVVEVIDLEPENAPHGLTVDPVADLLYATVESSGGALAVIDLRTRKVVDLVPSGAPGPHWCVITPDGRKAYVSNKPTPYVSVVDLVDRRLDSTVAMPHGAEELDISPDGRSVYVAAALANYRAGAQAPAGLAVIDTATDTVVRLREFDHPLSPVHVAADGRVLVAEVRTAAPEGEPRGQFAVDGVAHVLAPDLSVLGSVGIGRLPITIRSTLDGSLGFVATLRSGTVDVLDLQDYRLRHTIEVDPGADPASNQGAHGLAYLPG